MCEKYFIYYIITQQNHLKNNEDFGCNCRRKDTCPLDNKCLKLKIIYKAEITNDKDQEKKIYIELAETPFKERYRNQTKSFNNKKCSKETELSKYIWLLKENNKAPTIKWNILKSIKSPLRLLSCQLCLNEKSFIIDYFNDYNLLNKRSEFISKCRNQNKFLLNSVKSDSHD